MSKQSDLVNITQGDADITGLSATFSGNLTVDSDTFFVDASNNVVGIGTSSQYSISKVTVDYDSTEEFGLTIRDSGAASDGAMVYFVKGGSVAGSIITNTSGTTYNTTSDRRLKENIELITDGKEKLLVMKPCTFSFKTDEEQNIVTGFIAQEMAEVVPEAVTGDPSSDTMMSIDYGRITPVIVAALQDALKEIEELKERIKTLEAK